MTTCPHRHTLTCGNGILVCVQCAEKVQGPLGNDLPGQDDTHTMPAAQEAHLQAIKDTFTRLVDDKYRKGQAEHGGQLWEKNGLLEEAINEVIDLAVYLLTFAGRCEHDASKTSADAEDRDVLPEITDDVLETVPAPK